MLLGAGTPQAAPIGGIDSIHNYYEKLVLEEIFNKNERSHTDGDFMADVACVALNRLPPRYIRYNVDMTFFMSIQELEEIHNKVRSAVSQALDYVIKRENERLTTEEPTDTKENETHHSE